MTRPRWPPELVAELIRRNKEDGVSLEALGKEYGVTKQAIWIAINREAESLRVKLYRRQVRANFLATKKSETCA